MFNTPTTAGEDGAGDGEAEWLKLEEVLFTAVADLEFFIPFPRWYLATNSVAAFRV